MKKSFFDSKKKQVGFTLAGIGLIALVLISAFAWAAGLIGKRVTTQTFLKDTPDSFPAGYRRAHGKGICFEGTFHASGNAKDLSIAQVFTQKDVPAIGRFSLGTGNPHAPDNSSRTVSMALMLTSDDGEQWRMKLNNKPFFGTRDAVGFLKQKEAFKEDPATGKPNPAKVEAFLKEYPEAKKSIEWDAKAPWTKSFAGAEYYVINAFLLVDSQGKKHPVRWSMRPHAPFISMSAEEREKASPNYLFDELKKRLEKEPLYWDLVLTIAEPGDPVNDPSQVWPADRKQIIAGTLKVTRVFDQTEGGCRDINFDPTLVPKGIALSDDPVLVARAGIYSHSYNARVREIGYGKATDAVGKPKNEKPQNK
ncbi:catalase family peroxidase [Chryseobacterium sp. CT-SW4]|uniref:catalase family peroxidase n=1 Tax=Chryseobacterium sp. SW-1 TaxID=3157343 RepID=UPI003B02522C